MAIEEMLAQLLTSRMKCATNYCSIKHTRFMHTPEEHAAEERDRLLLLLLQGGYYMGIPRVKNDNKR